MILTLAVSGKASLCVCVYHAVLLRCVLTAVWFLATEVYSSLSLFMVKVFSQSTKRKLFKQIVVPIKFTCVYKKLWLFECSVFTTVC